jgi:hypothetical protein
VIIADILPRTPVKAPQFKVHISCFLRKCNKGKAKKMICPYDIRKHNFTVFSQGKDILQ